MGNHHGPGKAYFEEGIKSKIDLVNAEVNLSDSKVALVEAEKTYKNSLVKLNNSMYIAFAPNYEIEATETFNMKEKLYTVDLEELDRKNDLSILPEDISEAAVPVATAATLRNRAVVAERRAARKESRAAKKAAKKAAKENKKSK